MTFYDKHQQADRRHQLERDAWAEWDAFECEFRTLGMGSGLTGIIYFNKCFEEPPFFTFSAALENLDDRITVEPIAYPSLKMSPVFDNLRWDGWVEDPQFESQMKWNDPNIPLIDDIYSDVFQWQSTFKTVMGYNIDEYTGSIFDEEWLQSPGWANTWIQGVTKYPTQPRWIISDEHGTSRPPRPSKYAAKYVFDSEGESRWLTWDSRITDHYQWWYSGSGPLNEEALFRTHLVQYWQDVNWTSAFGFNRGGYMEVGISPSNAKWTLKQDIWSSAHATWEVSTQFYSYGEFELEPPEPHHYFEQAEVQPFLMDHTFQVDLTPGWNTVILDWTVPPEFFPNLHGSGWAENDSLHGMCRFKAYGVESEEVHLARTLLWPDFSSAPPSPFVTVGVADWIRDEKGMYIGANLWVKAGGLDVLA